METKEPQRFTEEKEKELKLIEIPRTISDERFERNREKADGEGLEHCPCCGRAIHNPTYFFNSAFGGMAYLKHDRTEYIDCWIMGVGPECRKKFPDGYVYTREEFDDIP